MTELRRVAVVVGEGEEEIARARLIDLVPAGFEEVERGGRIELAAFVDAGTEAQLRAAFEDVRSEAVEPGWEHRWREFHRGVLVGTLWVGPPWESPRPDATARVVIDPGLAFGTGAHPTTQLCLGLLLEQPTGSVLDIGCGSGVLAIAAALLGHVPAIAVDSDPRAIEATVANAGRNGVMIDARAEDARHAATEAVDLAIANIAADVIESFAEQLAACCVITSGYLEADRPVLPRHTHVRRRTREGWAADLYERQ